MAVVRTRSIGRAGRDYIGVGVAAGVLTINGELALLRRLRGGDPGLWGLPGGRVRVGEAFEKATLREVYEEIGVRGSILCSLGVIEDISTTGHWISALYLVGNLRGEAANRLPSIHEALEWFEPKAAPTDLTIGAATVIRRLLEGKGG